MIALGKWSGELGVDRHSLYFISQSILLDFLLHAYITLIKGEKIIQDSLAVTSWDALAQNHSAKGCNIIQGCVLRKHLLVPWNVEKGTIKPQMKITTQTPHIGAVVLILTNSAGHGLTSSITEKHLTRSGKKQPCFWDINSLLSIQVHKYIECMMEIR